MKIGIIIPDRNDRPEFLANCLRMIDAQEFEFNYKIQIEIQLVNYKPLSDKKDITQRYRKGYEYFTGKGFDCILLMENDDWYSNFYIKTMVSNWVNNGKPDVFGICHSYYYHIGLCRYKYLYHPRRASAMNTLLKPDLEIKWPVDEEPYTDMHLWQQLKGVTFVPKQIISMGIKHNVGTTGGAYHSTKLDRYDVDDKEMLFLKNNMDEQSLNFYTSMHEKIQSSFR